MPNPSWSVVILMTTCLSFLTSPVHAATRVFARERAEVRIATRGMPKITEVLGMTVDEDVSVQEEEVISEDRTKVRFQETYKGIKVFDSVITVTVDTKRANATSEVTGVFIQNIDEDLKDVKPKLSPSMALKRLRRNKGHNSDSFSISQENANLGIFQDTYGKAKLVYEVTYFVQSTDKNSPSPSRPLAIIDALTGEILDEQENLNSEEVTCPSGNIKSGKVFETIKVDQLGGVYTMENANVKVVHFMSGTDFLTKAYSYKNSECEHDDVNGAYSPLTSAMHGGQKVYEMYKAYVGEGPVSGKAVIGVHYGKSLRNAFWTGQMAVFGDGDSVVHPLVSLDLVAHELSHGFTEAKSGLVYSRESGAIDETFSDMAGEAAKYFTTGQTDFRVGWSVTKQQIPLRYMYDPSLDGKSIKHASGYDYDLDVHYNSGLFNYAFYTLCQTSGWDPVKTFKLFAHANKMYWHANIGFNEAACDVEQAALDYDYSVTDVKNAFNVVGLDGCMSYTDVITLQASTGKYFTYLNAGKELKFVITFPANMAKARLDLSGGESGRVDVKAKNFYLPGKHLNDFSEDNQPVNGYNFEHSFLPGSLYINIRAVTDLSNLNVRCSFLPPTTLTSGSPTTGLSGAKGEKLFFVLTIPESETPKTVTFVTTGGTGDVDVYYKYNSIPQRRWSDKASISNGNNEEINVDNPSSGYHYIMLHAYNTISNVRLTGSYTLHLTPSLSNGVPMDNLSGALYEQLHYFIYVPTGAKNLVFRTESMANGAGDVDIYVELNKKATLSSSQQSYNEGNNEEVSVPSPASGNWYVMLDGYEAFSGVKFTASYQSI